MARRSGTAILPLHGGRVPPWLATRMSALGAVISQAIVHHYGREEFLQRLAHPFWFQSFGAVMGMDWHSSGIPPALSAPSSEGWNRSRMNLESMSAAAEASIHVRRRMNCARSATA